MLTNRNKTRFKKLNKIDTRKRCPKLKSMFRFEK